MERRLVAPRERESRAFVEQILWRLERGSEGTLSRGDNFIARWRGRGQGICFSKSVRPLLPMVPELNTIYNVFVTFPLQFPHLRLSARLPIVFAAVVFGLSDHVLRGISSQDVTLDARSRTVNDRLNVSAGREQLR